MKRLFLIYRTLFDFTSINVSLPEDVLERIDKTRKEKRLTRSEFLRQASDAYFHILEEEKRELEKIRGIEKAIQLQDEIRKRVGKWDALKHLRRWREFRK